MGSAVHIDAFKENHVEMQIQIDRTAKTLDKCDRSRLDVGSREASCDGFVHIILPNRRTDDRMDLRGQLLGRGNPIPQGEGAPLNWRPFADAVAGNGHRDDPLAGGDPGDDPLHQVGGGLGHAPTGTRRTKTPPLAAEGQQQLFVAGVTAQP